MNQITINQITVDVIRKDIKNIHLAVYPPTGRVRIAAPLMINDEAIRLFAASKIAWIKRNQRKFAKQERIAPRVFKERESHYVNGKRYLLRIKDTESAAKIDLKGKTYLDMYVKADSSIQSKKQLLDDWYRKELRKKLEVLLPELERKIKVKANFVGIRQMKNKWGSCNTESKRIWINLELAKKPIACVEYILIHEMVHLFERHHNDKFKAYMDQFLPNWKQIKEELNRLPVSHAEWGY